MLTQMLLCIHSSRPHHDPAVPLLREVRDRRRVLLGTGHGRIHWLGPPIVFGGGRSRAEKPQKSCSGQIRQAWRGEGRSDGGRGDSGLEKPPVGTSRLFLTIRDCQSTEISLQDTTPNPWRRGNDWRELGLLQKKSARPPTRGRTLAEMRLPKEMMRVRRLPCDTHLLHTRDPGRLYHFLREDF